MITVEAMVVFVCMLSELLKGAGVIVGNFLSGRVLLHAFLLALLCCVSGMSAWAANSVLIKVVGVSDFNGRQTALLEDQNTGGAAFYRLGDVIYGWKLTRISTSGIVLEREGKTESYDVFIAPRTQLRPPAEVASASSKLSFYDREYVPLNLRVTKQTISNAKDVIEGRARPAATDTTPSPRETQAAATQPKDKTSILSAVRLGRGGRFASPIASYKRVSSSFGYRRHPVSRRVKSHTGIDLAASTGTRLYAADSGQVVFSGWRGGYGRCIVIDHHNGYQTLYGHLSRTLVSSGANVRRGATIGLVGSTGVSTGPHLHFEVRQNGRPVNPARHVSF